MKPTQAQIEAARSHVNEVFDAAPWLFEPPGGTVPGGLNLTWGDIAALNAAAEAGDNWRVQQMVAGNAAAEAGELKLKYTDRDLDANIEATIERCAQIVDALAKKANRSEITKLEEAAAAIRAMKDKP